MTVFVQLSGGAASYVAAREVIQEAADDVTLLFADTLVEDVDLYRFLDDIEAQLGPIVRIADGRTPWQVFEDERLMCNTRADPCSKLLKRRPLWRYIREHGDPIHDTVVLGFDATEAHRLTSLRELYKPWRLRAPVHDLRLFREDCWRIVEADGIDLPRLYRWGFPHNNCGGACGKAGQATWALLHRFVPDRFTDEERREKEFRERLGKDVAFLRDRTGGTTTPLPLSELRRRLEREPELIDWNSYGGCNCMMPA